MFSMRTDWPSEMARSITRSRSGWPGRTVTRLAFSFSLIQLMACKASIGRSSHMK